MDISKDEREVGNYKEAERRRLKSKRILIGAITLFIIILLLTIGGGFEIHTNYLDKEIKKIDSLQNELDIRGIVYDKNYIASQDSISKIDTLEVRHEKGFIKFKTKDDATQKKLDDINNLNAPYPKLDSLAENIRFQ